MANRSTRRVIAVVIDSFAPFHQHVLNGLRKPFSAAGYGTLAVAGRDVDQLILPTQFYHDPSSSVSVRLDVQGAVVVSGDTKMDMDDEQAIAHVSEYAARLTDGPVVSFGIKRRGLPSVTTAWDETIVELMDDLLSDASRKRFVFIRGFEGDPHSQHREDAFRAGLKRAGIAVHEELIIKGDYTVADANAAVADLIKRGERFDGILAANDDMASGAMAALSAATLRVPQDVVIAGFDDSLASFICEPPLTSARFDIDAVTQETANLILNAIEDNIALHPDLEIQVPSCLVRRASTRVAKRKQLELNTSVTDVRSALLAEIFSRWETERAPNFLPAVPLAQAVVQTMLTGDDSFERECSQAAGNIPAITALSDIHWMKHAVRELRAIITEAPPGLIPHAGLRATLHQLVAVDEWRIPIARQVEVERTAHRYRQERLVMRLAACSDPDSLWRTLRRGLASFGMTNAWVATNVPADPDAGVEAGSTMRLAFSLADDVEILDESFDRENILPDRFRDALEKDVHVMVPLRAGASDIGYMVLEPHGEYLLELEAIGSGIAQVLRHVEQVVDLERQTARLQMANEALDHLARRDSLTGLANRKAFLDALEQQIDSVRHDEQVAILFFDLDGFKKINDSLGHEAGDHLLRIVANRVGEIIGAEDTLARLGGDEFIAILRTKAGSTRPVEISHRILESVAQTCIINGEKTKVSASLGIALFPQDGVTTDELVRNADAAMYQAKSSGKGCFSTYSASRSGARDSEVELREALRVGLENDEFDLEFQPRVNLQSGEIIAFEGLLRWNPSTDISEADRRPDRFVVVAERNGLIAALDSVSLDRACREAKRWAEAGFPVPVSVNMSVKRLQEADIATQVADVLERCGLPPELLELELSEQALVSDREASYSKLQSVREMGVRCSIDDYGTGNSSVSDLAHLPIDIVKIDQTLIAGICHGETFEVARRNVKAILGLTSVLELTAVAEGIETAEQLEFLTEIGCEQGQGFEMNRRPLVIPEGAADVWPAIASNDQGPEPGQGSNTNIDRVRQAAGVR